MSTASPTRPRPRVDLRSRPDAILVLGMAAVAFIAIWTGIKITAVVLDETVYKYAAARYTEGLSNIVNDDTSRGIARLYSVLIAPAFALYEGDVAVRVARALNGVLFAATAIPVAALARRAGATRTAAAAAGVLSVAVPWLTLATILFSESLAYLLFACVVLAMLRLLERPGIGREALVLGLLGALVVTRVQFLVVGVAWVGYLAISEWRAGRRPWRAFPLTFALVALAILALAVRAKQLLGPYFTLRDRTAVPGDFGVAALWEVEMLALGVGVVPALLAVAWFAGTLTGARPEAPGAPARRLAVLSVVLLGALAAGTLFAQGGWLDLNSEERYYIYVVPFLWIGAVAALSWRELPARWLGWSGVALAVIVAAVSNPVPLRTEQLFLGPVSGVLRHGLPRADAWLGNTVGVAGVLSGRDLLTLGVLALTAFAVVLWRRNRRIAALVPAVVVQLAFIGYAFAGIDGRLEGIEGAIDGRSFAVIGWVDRAIDDDRQAAMADNAVVERERTLRDTMFWNDQADARLGLQAIQRPLPPYPVDTLGFPQVAVGPDLRIAGRLERPLVVQEGHSPLWQIEGRPIDSGEAGRLELIDPGDAPALRWLAEGLQTDGQVTGPAQLHVPGRRTVEVTVAAPQEGAQAALEVRLGGAPQRFDSAREAETTLVFDLCRRGGVVAGSATPVRGAALPDGRTSAGLLTGVRVLPCG